MMRHRTVSVLRLCACLLMAGAPARAQTFRFILRADPATIVANGLSATTISVEVNQTDGLAVDGSAVHFVTTLGVIQESATLINGSARATLRAGSVPGIATVTALIGPARETVEVEMISPTAGSSWASRAIEIKGEYLAYSVDRNVITASGPSEVRFRQLTVRSDVKMQLDLGSMRMLVEGRPGQNSVSIDNGASAVTGDQLSYLLRSHRGVMLRVNPTPARETLTGDDLQVDDESPVAEGTWDPILVGGTQSWVVARRIVVIPNEKIQFHHASIYVNDVHLVSLPIHVVALGGLRERGISGLFGDRSVAFNSSGGLSLDVPFYYRANTRGTGAVRLQRAGTDGFFAERSGWSLALEEQYTMSNGGQGTLMIDQLPRSNWGISLEHEQPVDARTRGYLFADFANHRDLFARASVNRRYDRSSLGVETFISHVRGAATAINSRAYWQADARPLGNSRWNYLTSAELGHRTNSWGTGGLSQTVELRLLAPPVWLTRSTSLMSSVEGVASHSPDASLQTGLGANVALSQNLGLGATALLSYTIDPGVFAFGAGQRSQYLSFTMWARDVRHDRWYANIFATDSLTQDSLFSYLSLSYRLHPRWRLLFDASYQSFTGTNITDYELGVGREFKNIEARIAYSKSRGKLFFELGATQF